MASLFRIDQVLDLLNNQQGTWVGHAELSCLLLRKSKLFLLHHSVPRGPNPPLPSRCVLQDDLKSENSTWPLAGNGLQGQLGWVQRRGTSGIARPVFPQTIMVNVNSDEFIHRDAGEENQALIIRHGQTSGTRIVLTGRPRSAIVDTSQVIVDVVRSAGGEAPWRLHRSVHHLIAHRCI